MYALTVNYPISEESSFDATYYKEKHIPLCARLLANHGYKGYVLHTAKGNAPGSADLSYATVELLFDSMHSLQAGLAEHGGTIGDDIPNYTNVQPQMIFSEASIQIT